MADRTKRADSRLAVVKREPERTKILGIPVPRWLENGTKGILGGTSGVTFVGPNSGALFRLEDGEAYPDAEVLSKAIAYTTSAYCFTAIDYRARKISEPPLYVAEKNDDGDEETLPDHELLPLLAEPSLDLEMTDLLKLTEAYSLISGAALWVKVRDGAQRVARLQPYSGDQVKTESADGRIYGRFRVLQANGEWKPYAPEDVVWIRDTNPLSWRRNVSRLEVALSQLDLGHQVNRTVRNFMRKAMFPGGVVSPHPDWDPSDDEWDAYVNKIEAWNAGPANAGAPLVVQGGTTFSRAAIPLKELLPSELLDRIEAVVSSVFGIPPIVLGWKIGLENSPWSQMEEARRSVYEETLIPRWDEIGRKLSRQLLSEEDRAARRYVAFDTSDLPALRTDDKVRAEVARMMINDWTRNERRVYTGQDPLPDDDPRGDEIGAAAPMSGIAALLGNGGTEDPDDEPDDEDVDETEEDDEVANAIALAYLLGRKVDLKGLDEKALEWALFDINTKAAERTWERSVARLLDDLKREVLRIASRTLKESKADSPLDEDSLVEFVAAVSTWIREKGERVISDHLFPLVLSTSETAVKRAASQIGVSFATLQPGLLTYAKEEADFLASVMGETTGKKVASVVQRSFEEGKTIAGLRKTLQEEASFSRKRAQLVARTETTRAWNGSQRRSMSEFERDSDESVKVYKEWLSSQDDRVRPEHDAMHGEKRRIDEPYSNGLQEPGEPNCRCTQLFSIEDVGA